MFARGYGLANLEYGVPNTPATVFHMASVSKQFTAFAIALLESRGQLSLDDDVRRHLPELPDFGVPVTLRQLVHHTSGLRDQWTLWAMAGGRLDDVIRQEDLLSLVRRQRELNFPPGSEHLYSNTGYTLLSEVVERVTGQSYGEWMRAEVFAPLGMGSTQIYDDHERLVPGRAYSYAGSPGGGYRKAVLSYANQGATSLFTTVEDLARWLGNFRTGAVGGAAVQARLRERGVLSGGDTIPYAFGLVVDRYRGLDRLQHGGADAGFRTSLLYFPALDAGVVTLSNLASFPGSVALRVAEAFFGDHMEAAPAAAAVPAAAAPAAAAHPVAPALLSRYAGTYALTTGVRLEFTVEGTQLYVRVGPERHVLRARSDTTFEVVGVAGASVRFVRESDGSVRRLVTVQNGEHEARRVEPWAPDAAALEAYAGRYYSDELETFYTMAVEEGQLVARHRRHGTLRLEAEAPDRFRAAPWFFTQLRFERAATGAVTGLRVSSGRVRDLAFVRVE